MKKVLFMGIVLLCLLSFSACDIQDTTSGKGYGKNAGVPEQYLKTDIEEFIVDMNQKGWVLPDEYTFTATHDYDKNRGIDDVTLRLEFTFESGTQIEVVNCSYQYEKETGSWHRISDMSIVDQEWEINEKHYEKKCTGLADSAQGSVQWTVDVQDYDSKKNTITCAIVLVKGNGEEYRTDGFCTYSLEEDSYFELEQWGQTYRIYLGNTTAGGVWLHIFD